jgi:inner membrane protein
MPSYKHHRKTGRTVGAIGGGLTYLSFLKEKRKTNPFYQFDLVDFLLFIAGGTAIGEVAGVLPDVLEPGIHSHHRNICHSATTATAITYGMHKAANSNLSLIEKAVINIAGSSYLSHLAMDAETPRGLPIIGK